MTIYIEAVQHNKSRTTISGLPQHVNCNQSVVINVLKELKLKFQCNGCINLAGKLELQGDHCNATKEYSPAGKVFGNSNFIFLEYPG